MDDFTWKEVGALVAGALTAVGLITLVLLAIQMGMK